MEWTAVSGDITEAVPDIEDVIYAVPDIEGVIEAIFDIDDVIDDITKRWYAYLICAHKAKLASPRRRGNFFKGAIWDPPHPLFQG